MNSLFHLIKLICAETNIARNEQIPLSALVLVGSDSPVNNISSMLGTNGQSGGFLLYLLIMGGILLIIGVLIYNWWEEKRFNEQVSKSFSEIDDDALLDQNKQAFLDKFAATTGYLNDAPDINQLPSDDKHAFDDKQSIDEVYSELLETIAKRTSASHALDENGRVTIDHDSIPSADAVLSANPTASTDDDASNSIYIPDVVELDVEEDGNVTGGVNNGITDNDQSLRKKESIRNIINEAFKAKYNPNYQKVVDVEIEPVSDVSEVKERPDTDVSASDAEFKITDEAAGLEDVNINENLRVDDVEIPEIALADDAINPLEELLGEAQLNESIEPEIHVADINPSEMLDEIVQNEVQSLDSAVQASDDIVSLEADSDENTLDVVEEEQDDPLDIKFPEDVLDGEINAQNADELMATEVENEQDSGEVETEESLPDDSTDMEILLTPKEINPQMDLVGELVIANVSPALNILETFGRLENDYDKPTFVFAQSSTNKWVMLNNASEEALTYHFDKNKPIKIVAGMQLADRSGPASKNTIQRFKNALEANSKEMGYKAHWPDTQDPVEKASSLDAFCIDVDKTMFFHILNDGTPFTGIKLRGLAEAQGMELTNDGCFKYYASAEAMRMKKHDFMLFNRDNHRFTPEMLRTSVIKAVTFQLDIPQIGADGQSLERMIEIAQHLKNNLNGTLVDDNNRPLSDIQMVKIREQIKSIHATMQLRGITPGSNHAFRLFS